MSGHLFSVSCGDLADYLITEQRLDLLLVIQDLLQSIQ
jgi:hypothetical protein